MKLWVLYFISDILERITKDMLDACQKICQKEYQKIYQKECQKIYYIRKNFRRYVRKNVKRYIRKNLRRFVVSRCVFIREAGLEELKWWSGKRCGNTDTCLMCATLVLHIWRYR